MTEHDFLAFSRTIVMVFVFLLFIGCIVRRYLIDRYRQDLFAIRDDLFDEVDLLGHGFDDKGYSSVRSAINGCIRYAHKTGPFLMMVFMLRNLKASNKNTLNEPFNTEDLELRPLLKRAMRRLQIRIFTYIVLDHWLTGPALAVCLILIQIVRHGFRAISNMPNWYVFQQLLVIAREMGLNRSELADRVFVNR